LRSAVSPPAEAPIPIIVKGVVTGGDKGSDELISIDCFGVEVADIEWSLVMVFRLSLQRY
jgi:hypothetical protein